MSDAIKASVEVITAIITVAIIAVVVSKKSNTSGVIQSFGDFLTNVLKVAVSPVTA